MVQPTCSPTLLQSGGENQARCPVTSALLELRGGHVAEGTVGPNCIVVQAPGLDDLARAGQAEEPVLVQTLVAESAVEALDVGILVRLARRIALGRLTAPSSMALASTPSRRTSCPSRSGCRSLKRVSNRLHSPELS